MADTVGRSIIEVGADATNLEAGMAAATKSVENFENKAEQSAQNVGKAFDDAQKQVGGATQKLDATTKRFLASLERESEQAGRARSEYLQLRAAKLGVSDQASAMIQRLQQQEAAQRAAADAAKAEALAQREAARAKQVAGQAMTDYGMSAKQTTAALRQVPAQITDIVVSLQGGQAPLTVLLQQGGQLRDIFGGVVPAFRALAGAVGALITPLNVGLAALAGLGFAFYQGRQQINEYNRALISSGGLAGMTGSQMSQAASEVGALTGRFGDARTAAAALAETGLFAGQNLINAMRGVAAGTEVTKREVGDLVGVFADIAKDPVKTLTELNLKYNFLTAEIYNQIRALQEQGRTQDAVTLGVRTFADTLQQRQGEIVQNLGYIERGWRFIKEQIGGAINTLQSFGRAQSDDNQLALARQRLESLRRSAQGASPTSGIARAVAEAEQQVYIIERRMAGEAQLADYRARAARDRQEAFAAEQRITQEIDRGKSKQQQLNEALAKFRADIQAIRSANPESAALRPANIAAAEAAIRARFREATGRAPRSRDPDAPKPDTSAAVRLLESLRQQEQATQAQLQNDEKLTASQTKLVQFNQQIADIKNKQILTADEQSLIANEQAIRAQYQRNIAVELELRTKQEETRELERQKRLLDQMTERSRQITLTIDQANESRRFQNQQRLTGFGSGTQAQEEMRSRLQINNEFQRYQDQLTRATPAELLGSRQYKDAVEQIKTGLQAALAEHESYYARLRMLQSDWTVGASQALQNYIDQAGNTAAITERIFTDAFKGLEDALTTFVTTGKLSFEDLSKSIVSSVTRAIIQAQIVAPLAQALQGAMGGGNLFASIAGSLFGAPGRALGGPVLSGRTYEVNENMPELLSFKGREFLMMGNQSGQIKPLSQAAQPSGGRPIVVNVQAVPNMSRQTALQQGATIGQGLRTAMARNT